jgi:type IV pilus assembly protein PilM
VAAALGEEFSRRKLPCRSAVFSLVSSKVAAREVMFPPVRANRLKALVDSNANEYFPVDMSKYHIGYTVLDTVEKGENAGHRVMVYAVPVHILEGYFRLASLAAFQISAIDYFGNSQYRALEGKTGDTVTMFVDAGCTSTCVTFMSGRRLILQRVLGSGADELVTGYMAATGKGDGDYAAALRELSSGMDEVIGAELGPDGVRESLGRLLSNIARIADYFNSSNWGSPVEQLVLMGVCSRVAGLLELISETVSIPAVRLEDLAGFSGLGAQKAELYSTYLSCFGASLQPVDLMPAQLMKGRAREKTKSDSLRPAWLFLAVCAALSAVMSAMALLNYGAAVNEKEETEQSITALEPAEAQYLAYMDYQNGIADFETLDGLTRSENDNLLDFIAELEEKMPSGISVLSAVCSASGVNMNVTVSTKEQAAMVIVRLRSFESLGQVNVAAISDTADENGIASVTFAVSCVYKEVPQTPAEPQPAAASAEPAE